MTTSTHTPAVCDPHGAPLTSDALGVMTCGRGCEATWPDLTPEVGTDYAVRDGSVVIVPEEDDGEEQDRCDVCDVDHIALDDTCEDHEDDLHEWPVCERCGDEAESVSDDDGLCRACDANNDTRVVI